MDNSALFLTIFDLHNRIPVLDKLMIFGANYLIFVVAALIFITGVRGRPREQKAAGLTVLGLLVGWGLIQLIHMFVAEPRPFATYQILPLIKKPIGLAFPSQHTTIMAATAFAFLFYKSKWTPWLLIAMLWVGFARIYVGVHYPLDILGGIIVGFMAVLISWNIKKYLRKNFLRS